MPILRFEGYSDDTFGEIAHTKDDYDNCASGAPIEYLVARKKRFSLYRRVYSLSLLR